MGRHRRSAGGDTPGQDPAPQGHTPEAAPDGMGTAPFLRPEEYADVNAKSHDYLYATGGSQAAEGARAYGADGSPTSGDGHVPRAADDAAVTAVIPAQAPSPEPGPDTPHRRRKKRAPVKTGLLGVSAAVALGAVAVATGVVPGLESYKLGGTASSGDNVRAADSPSNSASEQGGTAGKADGTTGGTKTVPAQRTPSSSPSAPSKSPSPSPSPSVEKTEEVPAKKAAPVEEASSEAPAKSAASQAPATESRASVAVSAEVQAGAEVLALVNQERAKVGCSPVSANSALTELAQKFSEDMAARGFFDHTDPDGKSPWDRAAAAGISDLGGENIARGQTDAAAVMDAWMNSPGHKANILNCDFKTLGVGVHFGNGGPWWTQDFGY